MGLSLPSTDTLAMGVEGGRRGSTQHEPGAFRQMPRTTALPGHPAGCRPLVTIRVPTVSTGTAWGGGGCVPWRPAHRMCPKCGVHCRSPCQVPCVVSMSLPCPHLTPRRTVGLRSGSVCPGQAGCRTPSSLCSREEHPAFIFPTFFFLCLVSLYLKDIWELLPLNLESRH